MSYFNFINLLHLKQNENWKKKKEDSHIMRVLETVI